MDYFRLAEKFLREMHAKYMKSVSRPGNTPQPWFDFSEEKLLSRLFEEIDELREAVEKEDWENLRDELLDVANFCMYLWGKLSVKNIYDKGEEQ
ncbi:MazG nucleotide pyrophosphohydrolase domain-containing protein [Archaeoglobus sp.]|uniref:MazG-like family protein n=1 Tax=Archaeoglobus sp. TaxID=1872626 RepID=UPI0024AA34D1|nr:MazG nucleotide pyrophosphohydrolase domain-containing protein [Archaeoglobus sp.]MDI3497086.1 hypothetical protein [Archaeoglobus sp.]